VYRDTVAKVYYSASGAAALDDSARARLVSRTYDDHFFYNTRYGTPLAYARPLEILAGAGLADLAGRRILDFGYGSIGHLRLMASLGAIAVGVEVDPLLPVLYSDPGDQGTVRASSGEGQLLLLDGQFPADDKVTGAVGEGYDLFLSKNTLKNGYLHPTQPVDPRRLVHLGVDDTTFVRTIFRILKPGGRALIYNLSPAPSKPGEPYKPWADGRSPFSREMWRAAGFKVLVFDKDDSRPARAMARALEWDKGGMDVEKDLFGLYTLVEKPAR
jgi:SAM-dependent methyltransferase